MKETRLRKILNPLVYETVINKYLQLIKNGEKDKALALKTIVYANIYPQLKEDGSNPWRQPNEFLSELCRLEYVFDTFYKALKTPNYRLFGKKAQEFKNKLL